MNEVAELIIKALNKAQLSMREEKIEALAHYLYHGCSAHYADYDVEYEYSDIKIEKSDNGFRVTLVDFQKFEDGDEGGDARDFFFDLVKFGKQTGCMVFGYKEDSNEIDDSSIRRLTFVAQELFLDFVM